MKRLLFLAPFLFYHALVHAQAYVQQITSWQQDYKSAFLHDTRSPLTAADTGYLRFYPANEAYRVDGHFVLTPDARTFPMATHAGTTKPYRCYGRISFRLAGKRCSLEVYRGLDLVKKPELRDYLFIPFTDLTNGTTTFGGGRYLDLKTGDIKDGRVTLDFNKAYNPYCAFGEGYACPIPPDANRLPVKVLAGEKMFGRQTD